MRRHFLSWLGGSALGATLGGLPSLALAQKSARTLTVGIVPQQSASELARLWIPVLGALS